MSKKDSNNSPLKRFTSLGWTLTACFIFFVMGGVYLDRKSGGVIWTLTGVVLALGFTAYEIWKIVKAFEDE